MDECLKCGWWDCELGCCTCRSDELWYQCPLEPEPTEDDFKTAADMEVENG